MVRYLKDNKFVIGILVVTIIFSGVTINNLPTFQPLKRTLTINGITYDFNAYPSLNDEQIALFNNLRRLISTEPVNSFDNWNADYFVGFLHYLFAFADYAMSGMFETTPGYRTDYYRDTAYNLIKKMNTTISEFGNDSIEYIEWGRTNYPSYYWPNATDPSDLYMGGYRGPANIMWTAHFTLMETLFERSFNESIFLDEIDWFINDWNNSLTTDGYGNLTVGGIWGVGLIPCEPYIVFSQCNSIAIYCTELYDNLYGTSFMNMWDYGLNFMNTVMHDEYDLFIDGYYIQEPIGSLGGMGSGAPLTIPGPAVNRFFDDGRSAESSYSNAWTLALLEYTQPEETITDYPLFVEKYGIDVSGDQMYMSGSFNNPSFASITDMLGTMFSCVLAKQRGDVNTVQRIQNFLFNGYNQVWSADKREMYYDTSSLFEFLSPVLAALRIWTTTPITLPNLADARPTVFWEYPFISQADDDKIWVYYAKWDPTNQVFLLNIKVDNTATLTFSNFDHIPVAHGEGSQVSSLTISGSDHTLTLEPGSYNFVIV